MCDLSSKTRALCGHAIVARFWRLRASVTAPSQCRRGPPEQRDDDIFAIREYRITIAYPLSYMMLDGSIRNSRKAIYGKSCSTPVGHPRRNVRVGLSEHILRRHCLLLIR